MHTFMRLTCDQTLMQGTHPMKSNKQRRAEILAARKAKREKQKRARRVPHPAIDLNAPGVAPVNAAELLPTNSYGCPRYVARGYYQDTAFICIDCGAGCVWTAQRQKWWYEVAKGHPETIAVRCKPCRLKERARKAAALAASEAGRARKTAARNAANATV